MKKGYVAKDYYQITVDKLKEKGIIISRQKIKVLHYYKLHGSRNFAKQMSGYDTAIAEQIMDAMEKHIRIDLRNYNDI